MQKINGFNTNRSTNWVRERLSYKSEMDKFKRFMEAIWPKYQFMAVELIKAKFRKPAEKE